MAERKTGRSGASVLDGLGEEEGAASVEKESAEEAGETTEGEGGRLTDRPTVLMYLPEELHAELDARYSELRAQARRAGVDFSKNGDFYPALLQAGLEHLEEQLEWAEG